MRLSSITGTPTVAMVWVLDPSDVLASLVSSFLCPGLQHTVTVQAWTYCSKLQYLPAYNDD
jgi:hypothetical protein